MDSIIEDLIQKEGDLKIDEFRINDIIVDKTDFSSLLIHFHLISDT
jgi:hypothetical protein